MSKKRTKGRTQAKNGNQRGNGKKSTCLRQTSAGSTASTDNGKEFDKQQDDLFHGFGPRVDLNEDGAKRKTCVESESEHMANGVANPTTRPKGLCNLGNTCYFNSVNQVLSQTPMLYEMMSGIVSDGTKATLYDESTLNDSYLKAVQRNVNGVTTEISDLEERLIGITLNGDAIGFETADIINGECNANEYDEDGEHMNEKNDDGKLILPLPQSNSLASQFASFMREMRSSSNKQQTVNPSGLLNEVGKKCPQFKGRQQQDSHELLMFVRDALKTDQIRRQRKALLNHLNIQSFNVKDVSEDVKKKVKSFAQSSNFTTVDALFGGYILSSIQCEKCQHSSRRFELFFDLSLPLSDDKPRNSNVTANGKGKEKTQEKNNIRTTTKSEVCYKSDVKNRRAQRADKKAMKREQKKTMKQTKQIDVTDDAIEENSTEIALTEIICNGIDTDVNEDEGNDGTVEHTADIEDQENGTGDGNKESEDVPYNSFKMEASCELNEIDSAECIALTNGEDECEEHCNGDEDRAKSPIAVDCNGSLEREGSIDMTEEDLEQTSLLMNDQKDNEFSKPTAINWCQSTIGTVSSMCDSNSVSLVSCLANVTTPEMLTGSNRICCEMCSKTNNEKVYCNGFKQMLIAFPPPILTLHLKRFKADGYRCINLTKINTFVPFPYILDLAPFCSKICTPVSKCLGLPNGNSMKYKLYGVVEHSGTLKGGHYTAYVKLNSSSKRASDLSKFVRLKPFIADVNNLLKWIESGHTNMYTYGNEERDNTTSDETGDEDASSWYYISDSHCSISSLDTVMKSQAYILFYERIC